MRVFQDGGPPLLLYHRGPEGLFGVLSGAQGQREEVQGKIGERATSIFLFIVGAVELANQSSGGLRSGLGGRAAGCRPGPLRLALRPGLAERGVGLHAADRAGRQPAPPGQEVP